ncbi:MAG: DUF2400 domain-containing protein, partial [Bacteroidales bacterium]|nr:DUF2400 domain-containing protein [Bacteroidales bacterium]
MDFISRKQLKEFLELKVNQYNHPEFIHTDPIQIPHSFNKPEDIEISAFFVSTIAWGQRKSIINKGKQLIEIMEHSPFEFIMNAKEKDFKPFTNFKHRTFNGEDCLYFLNSLQNIYKNHNGLKGVFYKYYHINKSIKDAIVEFRKVFFELDHLKRTKKHVSDITRNASAKRLNMFLRWM